MSLAVIIKRTKSGEIHWERKRIGRKVFYTYEANGNILSVECNGQITILDNGTPQDVPLDLRLNLCHALTDGYLNQYNTDINLQKYI